MSSMVFLHLINLSKFSFTSSILWSLPSLSCLVRCSWPFFRSSWELSRWTFPKYVLGSKASLEARRARSSLLGPCPRALSRGAIAIFLFPKELLQVRPTPVLLWKLPWRTRPKGEPSRTSAAFRKSIVPRPRRS